MISTKIIATIGPASDSKEQIANLIHAGVNIFRCNLKHGTVDWHRERTNRIREVSDELKIPVGILYDLQGAEIRTGAVPNGALELTAGEEVRLVYTPSKDTEKKEIIIPEKAVVDRLKTGDQLLIDDGKIKVVVRKTPKELLAEVTQGGILGNTKSIGVPDSVDVLPSVTEHDKKFIQLAHECEVDFLALSYVRTAADITLLKKALVEEDYTPCVVAKIETAQALDDLENILIETDAVMVARGDLGVELPPEQVPYYQKHIINRCVAVGKPVITATQMLESMIQNPYPTRAEISDIANAMYDHSDAIMLSGETAMGKHPVEAVKMMVATAKFIEQHIKPPRVIFEMRNQTDALTHAAAEFARQHYENMPDYKGFVILTESGYAARMISRHRHHLPIVALTRHKRVLRQMLLQWGVIPLYFEHDMKPEESSTVTQIDEMMKSVRESNILPQKSFVIMVYGSEWGHPGRTNVIRIEQL